MLELLNPFRGDIEGDRGRKEGIGRSREGRREYKKARSQAGRSSYLNEIAARDVPELRAYGLLNRSRG
jgi:hypothetical protein